MPSGGVCRYCQGPLSMVRRSRVRGPVHTEAACREEIDRRIAGLLSEGLTTVDQIALRLDTEGDFPVLSEYVIQNSVNRVMEGTQCPSSNRR